MRGKGSGGISVRSAKVSWLTFLVLGLLALPVFPQTDMLGFAEREAKPVSLVAILANPKEYDGVRVRTSGVLTAGFESNAIFLTKGDWEARALLNAVYFTTNIPDVNLIDLERFEGVHVMIEGVVNAGNRGHMALFTATLEDVNLIFEM